MFRNVQNIFWGLCFLSKTKHRVKAVIKAVSREYKSYDEVATGVND